MSTADDLRYLANHCRPLDKIIARLGAAGVIESLSNEDLWFLHGFADSTGIDLVNLALDARNEGKERREAAEAK